MKELPVHLHVTTMRAGDTWELVAKECPLSTPERVVHCMSGAYNSNNEMVRLSPVCQYTKEQACTRVNDGKRTHQHCYYDEGGFPDASESDHVKWGHVVVRLATPEEEEQKRILTSVDNTGRN
jgi:hypothetical protein